MQIEHAYLLLHWNNDPDYTGEFRVLEKLGFNEIEYREKAIELNGVWLNGVVYELRR